MALPLGENLSYETEKSLRVEKGLEKRRGC